MRPKLAGAILLAIAITGTEAISADSNQSLEQRIDSARSLFVLDATSTSSSKGQVANSAADINGVVEDVLPLEQNIRGLNRGRIASTQIESSTILGAFRSASKSIEGQPWRNDQILSFVTFDGDLVYLDNKSVVEIAEGIAGWYGQVIDASGINLGVAEFSVFSDGKVRGNIYLNGRGRLRISPSSDGYQTVTELVPPNTFIRVDEQWNPSPEEWKNLIDEERRRLDESAEYQGFKEKRDDLVREMIREKENAESRNQIGR